TSPITSCPVLEVIQGRVVPNWASTPCTNVVNDSARNPIAAVTPTNARDATANPTGGWTERVSHTYVDPARGRTWEKRPSSAIFGISTRPATSIASGINEPACGYCPTLCTSTKLIPPPYSCDTAEAMTVNTPTVFASRIPGPVLLAVPSLDPDPSGPFMCSPPCRRIGRGLVGRARERSSIPHYPVRRRDNHGDVDSPPSGRVASAWASSVGGER